MKSWMLDIKAGHRLRPMPQWNNTEKKYRQLPVPTEVLGVKEQRGCQSGVLLKVQFKGGGTSWLDAGWFFKPNSKYPAVREASNGSD